MGSVNSHECVAQPTILETLWASRQFSNEKNGGLLRPGWEAANTASQ